MKNVSSKVQPSKQQNRKNPPSGGARTTPLFQTPRCVSEVVYVGLDLGDRQTYYVMLNQAGQVVERGTVATTRAGLTGKFEGRQGLAMVLEVGTHSCWVSRLLREQGHEVLVADARKTAPYQRKRKSDPNDAEMLARLLRADRELLGKVEHSSVEVQRDLALLRARDGAVAMRTQLINTVRGQMKSFGYRLPKCSAESFASKALLQIPPELRGALVPLLELIEEVNQKLRLYDRHVQELADKKHPETKLLRQIPGVGPLTALTFILRLGDKRRFVKSRNVGPYLGLVPRKEQSGTSDPQLSISKNGDEMLRRLLVTSAHYILGPFGPDCDLRRKGMQLAERGGKNAKKRAVVAVARKLAVLLHRLWVTGEVYEPLRQAAAPATVA